MAKAAKKRPVRSKASYKAGWAKRRANKKKVELIQMRQEGLPAQSGQNPNAPRASAMHPAANAGGIHGAEIEVAGWVVEGARKIEAALRANFSDQVIALAKKKDGAAEIQKLFDETVRQRILDASRATTVEFMYRADRERQTHMERVVCGFISEVDDVQRFRNGMPPEMIWTLSAHTVRNIVDALNKAGYHAGGIRNPPSDTASTD